MGLNRRDVLKLGLFSSAALMLPAERLARAKLAVADRMPTSRLPKPFTVPFATPPVLEPTLRGTETDYYNIVQKQAGVEILPGYTTQIWGYNGITPGPTIKVRRGRKSVVRQANNLPDVHPTLRYNVWSSTHLHGSASLPEYDGYASDITYPGECKDYRYPNAQDGRTLWYHDHGVHITAENAYMGLAGMYIMQDDFEQASGVPQGPYDVPLILRDALFTSKGELIFDDNSESSVMGDVILANGRPWPVMRVEQRKYRFRVLNASISRSYDYSLSTGDPFWVIATDGGLMPQAQVVTHIRHGMAERYEIVIDFSKYKPGQRVVLRNNNSLPNNINYDNTDKIMAFDIVGPPTSTAYNGTPTILNADCAVMKLTDRDAVKTRQFVFERKNSSWTINGTTWDDVVNSDYRRTLADPKLGTTEIWELRNKSGGWFHPVHIHLIDFKVLDRNGKPPHPWEMGPKDVVYVGENETVRVAMTFGPHTGRYMMHCHNLVHEDHDMMGQFNVVGDIEHGGHDPRLEDAARPLPFPDFHDEDLDTIEPPDDPADDDNSGSSESGS
jgi:spore coat protein A